MAFHTSQSDLDVSLFSILAKKERIYSNSKKERKNPLSSQRIVNNRRDCLKRETSDDEDEESRSLPDGSASFLFRQNGHPPDSNSANSNSSLWKN